MPRRAHHDAIGMQAQAERRAQRVAGLLRESLVEEPEDRGGLRLGPARDASSVAHQRRRRRGANPLARHVADDREPGAVVLEELVEVSADVDPHLRLGGPVERRRAPTLESSGAAAAEGSTAGSRRRPRAWCATAEFSTATAARRPSCSASSTSSWSSRRPGLTLARVITPIVRAGTRIGTSISDRTPSSRSSSPWTGSRREGVELGLPDVRVELGRPGQQDAARRMRGIGRDARMSSRRRANSRPRGSRWAAATALEHAVLVEQVDAAEVRERAARRSPRRSGASARSPATRRGSVRTRRARGSALRPS